jgi:hypothetical protein
VTIDLDLLPALRRALATSIANLPRYEAMAAAAQQRLLHERVKMERLRDLAVLLEAEITPPENDTLPREDEPPVPTPERGDAQPQHDASPAREVGLPRHHAAPVRGEDTRRAQLRDAITAFLRQRGVQHRSEILTHVQALGFVVTGRDPAAQLSAFLFKNRDVFRTVRRGYCGLYSDSLVQASC